MIRKTTNGDISDDEFEAVLKPFLDDYDNFIYSYVMPEIIAYYIANAFNRNSMYSGTFNQHYNSAKDMLNLSALGCLKHSLITPSLNSILLKSSNVIFSFSIFTHLHIHNIK